MVIVYSAANSLEAYMLKGLLEQHEIPAYVQGEHLQSIVGKLPAMSGLVKVSVDDEHKVDAIKLIKEWEATNPIDTHALKETNKPKEKSQFPIFSCLASFIIGMICMHQYLKSPTFTDPRDFNNDGKIDAQWQYHDNEMISHSADMNFDGKTDIETHFKDGRTDFINQDSDFDGYFETKFFYKNEAMTQSKIDTNKDEHFNLVTDYELNQLNSKTTIFSSKTGLAKKVQHFNMGKLTSAEFDADNDGKMDTLITYDTFEEELSRKPINN